MRALVFPLLLFGAAAAGVLWMSQAGDEAYEIPETMEIEVVGSKFTWKVRYPGPDGRLHTEDDRIGEQDVHIPEGTRTTIHLRSRDYVYGLGLPALGLKNVAIPELEFALEVPPQPVGTTELRGNQMCGYTHPRLMGQFVVESRRDYIASVRRLGR